MNIVVNSENEDESQSQNGNDSLDKAANGFIQNNVQGKKKGHFRGDSFGDSVPLENTLPRKDIETPYENH
jgi:hypothetical protein